MNHKLVVSFDFLKLVFNFFLQVFRTDPHTIGDDRVKGNAGVGIAVDQAWNPSDGNIGNWEIIIALWRSLLFREHLFVEIYPHFRVRYNGLVAFVSF